jgi:hypothetical protein
MIAFPDRQHGIARRVDIQNDLSYLWYEIQATATVGHPPLVAGFTLIDSLLHSVNPERA